MGKPERKFVGCLSVTGAMQRLTVYAFYIKTDTPWQTCPISRGFSYFCKGITR